MRNASILIAVAIMLSMMCSVPLVAAGTSYDIRYLPASFSFWSADQYVLDDETWNPWTARIVAYDKAATTWSFWSRDTESQFCVLNVTGHTYKPYPGQTSYYTHNWECSQGTYGAIVKVFVTGPSICQDLFSNPKGGYYCSFQGQGHTTNRQWPFQHPPFPVVWSDCNSGFLSSKRSSDGDGWANYGYACIKQTDYPGVPYGKNSGYTFPQKACYLIGLCNLFRLDPLSLQNWLKEQPDGFINGSLVNPYAFLRYLNSSSSSGGWFLKRNVPLSEALDRGLKTLVHVRNNRHWVVAAAHQIKDEASSPDFRIIDSANRNIWTLGEYSGVNMNDTRCFYQKGAYKAQSMDSADWGLSGILVASSNNIGVSLINSAGQVVGVGVSEFIEDATASGTVSTSTSSSVSAETMGTGTDPDLVGITLIAENVPSDNYTVRLTGETGAAYSVNVYQYGTNGLPAMQNQYGNTVYYKTYTGTMGASGSVGIAVPHPLQTTVGALVNLDSVANDTVITFEGTNAVITGYVNVPSPNAGFYVQVPGVYTKPLFVKSTLSPDLVGRRITTLTGKVVTMDDGQKAIEPTAGGFGVNTTLPRSWPNPVGASPELVGGSRGTGHRYTRTWGRVTISEPDWIMLNDGALKVAVPGADLPVGAFVQLDGVEQKHWLYVGNKDSIKRIQ